MKPWLVTFLALGLVGCRDSEEFREKPSGKEELLQYVGAGFHPIYPGVFFDKLPGERWSRTALLLESLGYSWQNYQINTSVDGNTMRLTNYGRGTSCVVSTERDSHSEIEHLILSKAAPPVLIKAQRTSYVSDSGKIVAWRENPRDPHKVTLFSGTTITVGEFSLDTSGEYFCDGGRYFNYNTGQREEAPLYVYSVRNPTKPLVRSKLVYSPYQVSTIRDSLYLFSGSGGDIPRNTHCEVYRRGPGTLTLVREFVIVCPRKWDAAWIKAVDFDGKTLTAILRMKRDGPFGDTWYLYGIASGEMLELGRVPAHFLANDIFENILGNANIRKEAFPCQ